MITGNTVPGSIDDLFEQMFVRLAEAKPIAPAPFHEIEAALKAWSSVSQQDYYTIESTLLGVHWIWSKRGYAVTSGVVPTLAEAIMAIYTSLVRAGEIKE